ncbi:uncharacterized protein LOC144687792 [Cetorhinus maximus]
MDSKQPFFEVFIKDDHSDLEFKLTKRKKSDALWQTKVRVENGKVLSLKDSAIKDENGVKRKDTQSTQQEFLSSSSDENGVKRKEAQSTQQEFLSLTPDVDEVMKSQSTYREYLLSSDVENSQRKEALPVKQESPPLASDGNVHKTSDVEALQEVRNMAVNIQPVHHETYHDTKDESSADEDAALILQHGEGSKYSKEALHASPDESLIMSFPETEPAQNVGNVTVKTSDSFSVPTRSPQNKHSIQILKSQQTGVQDPINWRQE